jgi:VCBS repeat-containing protein
MSPRSASARRSFNRFNRLRFEGLEERRLLAIAVAEGLLVDLDARDPSAGSPLWDNKGSLADFTEVGNPVLVTRGPNNNPAVSFNEGATSDAYNGPSAPATIASTGATRSIEAWVFNPTISGEETLVSLAKRGGPDGTNMSFNYGSDATFGAAGQWGPGPDMGWGPGGSPVAGVWHHLVITYDGNATSVYSDGELKNREIHGALATYQNNPIRIAAQTNGDGSIALDAGLVGHLAIANVRVHAGVLTASQVINNYNEDAARFGKTIIGAAAPAPVHRYAFNDSGVPGLDSIGGANAQLFNGASVNNGVLNLNNNGSLPSSDGSGQYALLPIGGTINGLTNATFEIWTTWRGGGGWQRAYDLGDNTNEYVFLSPMSGAGTARFEVKNNAANVRITESGSFVPSNVSEHHYVGVIDASNNQMRFYVDGALVATNTLNGFTPSSIGATVNNWLGRSEFGGDPYYNGTIDEFRVYNTALTDAQVRSNTLAGPNAVPGVNDRPVASSDGSISPSGTRVPLQNATAQFTQNGFSVAALIDGVLPGANSTSSWADDTTGGGFTPSNTAVFETVNNLNPDGNMQLINFQITSGDFGTHLLGNIRLSATTDDRSLFADGLANGGDISANWVQLTPVAVSTTGASTLTIRPDNTIFSSGAASERETYNIRVLTNLKDITGFRLEAIEDPALPNGGPGRSSANNGNFVVQEFTVYSQLALQSPTAQFTQGGFNPLFLIDGVPNPAANSTQSWADAGSGSVSDTNSNVFVAETVADVNPNGKQTLLTFNITSGDFGNHNLGNIRLSVTTDDRNSFANGAANGGAVAANWTQLTPLSVTTSGTSTFTIRPDNTILAGGAAQERETYTIRALTNLANITGFRLEALEDPSLPGSGPGRPANGNFVVQEFAVDAQTGFATVSEDGSITLNVLANDTDPDGDALTITGTSGGLGTIVNNGNNLTYTPGAAFQNLPAGRSGFDVFNYTVRDPSGLTSTASVGVLVTGANDPPTAVNDAAVNLVTLANPTDTFDQGAPFTPANSINGVVTENAGWAIFGQQTQNQTAVFQAASTVNPGPIGIEMYFDSPNSAHKIQNFRISVTNSPNPTVSSGAVWTELTPTLVTTSSPTSDATLQASNRVQITGDVAVPDIYFFSANNPLTGVTGIRLEAFAVNGTVGFNSGGGNGNIVLTEFRVRTGVTTSEDTVFNGSGLLLNDTDVDGPTSGISVSPTGARTSALGAAVVVNANGTFTYDPTGAAALQALGAGQTATDTFTYSDTDGTSVGNLATVTITVIGANDAPTANAGGPYTIAERQNLQLNAAIADKDANATLTIAWDLDNDGQFDDATGANPLVTWATLTSMTNPILDQAVNLPIKVRVSDGIAPAVVANGTLTVTNAAPTVSIAGPASAVTGQPVDFDFTIDDAPADRAAGFKLEIDWDGNGTFEETINGATPSMTVTHAFTNTGSFTVRARATDKDLAASTVATTSITISQVVVDNGVLLIGGSGASERIVIQPGSDGGLQVRINNKVVGNFSDFSEGMVFGGGGADNITIASNVGVPFTIDGGDGNDYIQGSSLGDTIIGGAGNDRILGGGGDDTILGGDGNDTLNGGLGNDLVDGEGGADIVHGDGGNDITLGGDGNDKLYGDADDDLVRGGEGSDVLDGGAGNDALSGDGGGDKLYGRAGDDVLVGGDSFDTLYGGTGEDLMNGNLLLDDSDDALMMLLASWTNGDPIEDRVLMSVDADEDGVGDTLYGEGGADWYLLMLSDRITPPAERLSPNIITTLP